MTKNVMTENILLVYLVHLVKRTMYHGGSRLIINYDFIEIMTKSRFFSSNGYF